MKPTIRRVRAIGCDGDTLFHDDKAHEVIVLYKVKYFAKTLYKVQAIDTKKILIAYVHEMEFSK